MINTSLSAIPDFSRFIRATAGVDDLEHSAVYAVIARSFEGSDNSYSCLRFVRGGLDCKRATILEQMATRADWRVWAVDPATLVLRSGDAVGIFVATGHGDQCVVSLRIWAVDTVAAGRFEAAFEQEAGPHRSTHPLICLEWRLARGSSMGRSSTLERITETVVDEAYPSLGGSVDAFVRDYLDSPEPILVLQGAPGLGKTRLIRRICAEMTRRKNDSDYAEVLCSCDLEVWKTDEIFMDFINRGHDALLIEDADHLLEPRSDGNAVMHRFLNISDGICQIKGRKIIYSTNLPNIGDIDEALVRPGRCFAHLQLRLLTFEEAGNLLERLCGADVATVQRGMDKLERMGKRGWSVADVYQAARTAGEATEQEVGVQLRLVGTT